MYNSWHNPLHVQQMQLGVRVAFIRDSRLPPCVLKVGDDIGVQPHTRDTYLRPSLSWTCVSASSAHLFLPALPRGCHVVAAWVNVAQAADFALS